MSYVPNYKKREISFLLNIVNNWMVADIVRMKDIPLRPWSGGNLNFPIVLYIFACMDFLGYLIVEENKKSSTRNRIWSYMEFTFGDDMEKFKKHDSYFIEVFRHSLTHQYFARGGGISRGKSEVIYFSPKFGLMLDADRFADIFIKSTKNFRNLFHKKKWKIKYPDLIDRVYERFTKLMQQNLYKTIKI